jgi:DNA-binding NarL/FixJ family response regulator
MNAHSPAREHAARVVLRDAVQALERVRRGADATSIDEVFAAWKVFVATRWSLLDHFDTDGKRYIVVCENRPCLDDARHKLSLRERQVMAYLALGRSTKLIAYDLGISDSTVRVLATRARRKLKPVASERS